MNGNEFISLASHLIVNKAYGNAEARYRSAVSRAYYGAFHLAVDFLRDVCQVRVKSNHEGHHDAYRVLINSGHANAQEAARYLDDLRTARNEADYELYNSRLTSEVEAKADVETASDFQAALERCQTEPARSQIMAAIKKQRP